MHDSSSLPGEGADLPPPAIVSAEAVEAPTARPVSRLYLWSALAGLLAVHASTVVFLNPFFEAQYPHLLSIALARQMISWGIIVIEPALLATVAVFWPVRWLVRFVVSLALMICLSLITMLYLARINNPLLPAGVDEISNALSFLIEFFLFQGVLGIIRWFRRWRIVSPGMTSSPELLGSQFSLRGLLMSATVVCLLLGLGRWVLSDYDWPDGWSVTVLKEFVRDFVPSQTLFLGLYLPLIPCLGLVLGARQRGWVLFWSLLGILLLPGFLVLWDSKNDPQGFWKNVFVLFSLTFGSYASVLFSLLVVRSCGFRLVRQPRIFQ